MQILYNSSFCLKIKLGCWQQNYQGQNVPWKWQEPLYIVKKKKKDQMANTPVNVAVLCVPLLLRAEMVFRASSGSLCLQLGWGHDLPLR